MIWTDKYIDLTFTPDGRDRNGVDCWGLVCLVYQIERGIELPKYQGILVDLSQKSLRAAARAYTEGKENWNSVDKPKPFDVILLRTGKYQWHAGLVVDRRHMLHIEAGINSCVADFTGPEWRHRVEEFRRYKP